MHALQGLFKGFFQLRKLTRVCRCPRDQDVVVIGLGRIRLECLHSGLQTAADPVAHNRIAHSLGDRESESGTLRRGLGVGSRFGGLAGPGLQRKAIARPARASAQP